jgi:hypothetical protein
LYPPVAELPGFSAKPKRYLRENQPFRKVRGGNPAHALQIDGKARYREWRADVSGNVEKALSAAPSLGSFQIY